MMYVCCDCGASGEKTGRNQKRCAPCAQAATRVAIRAHAVRTGVFKGTGGGAHNTPGDKHPQWAGGERRFAQVLAPAYWKRTRYCERCSLDLACAAPEFRCVHHRDHNRKNNREENFELLCKRCHQVEHECWKNLPNGHREGATTIPKGSTAERPEVHGHPQGV